MKRLLQKQGRRFTYSHLNSQRRSKQSRTRTYGLNQRGVHMRTWADPEVPLPISPLPLPPTIHTPPVVSTAPSTQDLRP